MPNENVKDIVTRFRTHVALGRELVHVRGQVVVLRNHFASAVRIGRNTSTGPETKFQVLGSNRQGAGGNVVGDIVVDIHIGFAAVGARYRTHVLDTTAHGGSRNGGRHIPTTIHVIVHQNVKEVVEAKNVGRRRLVLGPGHSVTVNGFITGEGSEAASVIVKVAQIRVVARIGVVAIPGRARTVPVLVLTITAKATHDGLILALAEMVNVVEHRRFGSVLVKGVNLHTSFVRFCIRGEKTIFAGIRAIAVAKVAGLFCISIMLLLLLLLF